MDSEAQLSNQLRQMHLANDTRKILLFFTQEHRIEFHNKTEAILEEVARIRQGEVVVIKTSSEGAMRRVLKVETDPFATIRLIDPLATQQPLFVSDCNDCPTTSSTASSPSL